MPMDVDYIFAMEAIDELKTLVENQEHGECEEIADEIITFVEEMKKRWKTD